MFTFRRVGSPDGPASNRARTPCAEGGIAPAWALDRVRRFNRRVFNPVVLALTAGGRRWARFALIRHVGRRSGRAYATPVWVIRTGDHFLVPLTYGTRADWCRNVLAAGTATVVSRGAAVAVDRPEVVGAAGVVSRLPPLQRAVLCLVGMRQFLLLRQAGAGQQGRAGRGRRTH